MEKKLNYEFPLAVVNYLLAMLDKVQISWVQSAKDLLAVSEMLKNPLNAEDMEKEQLEELKAKYEKKKDK
jgi:hypothetical protein